MSTRPEKETTKVLEALKAENHRLRGTVSLLSDLGRRITSSLELATVLQSVVDAACELTKARYGALAVFDSSGQHSQILSGGLPHRHQRQPRRGARVRPSL